MSGQTTGNEVKAMGFLSKHFGKMLGALSPADRADLLKDAAASAGVSLQKAEDELMRDRDDSHPGAIEDQWDGPPDDQLATTRTGGPSSRNRPGGTTSVGPSQAASGDGAAEMERRYSRPAPQGGVQRSTEMLGRDLMKAMRALVAGMKAQGEQIGILTALVSKAEEEKEDEGEAESEKSRKARLRKARLAVRKARIALAKAKRAMHDHEGEEDEAKRMREMREKRDALRKARVVLRKAEDEDDEEEEDEEDEQSIEIASEESEEEEDEEEEDEGMKALRRLARKALGLRKAKPEMDDEEKKEAEKALRRLLGLRKAEDDEEEEDEEEEQSVSIAVEQSEDEEDEEEEEDEEGAKSVRAVARSHVKLARDLIAKSRAAKKANKAVTARKLAAQASGHVRKAMGFADAARKLDPKSAMALPALVKAIRSANKALPRDQAQNQDNWPASEENKAASVAIATQNIAKAVEQIQAATSGLGMLQASVRDVLGMVASGGRGGGGGGPLPLPPVFELVKSNPSEYDARTAKIEELVRGGAISRGEGDRSLDTLMRVKAAAEGRLDSTIAAATLDRLPPVVRQQVFGQAA